MSSPRPPLGRASITLTLTNETQTGRVFFNDGQIIGADSGQLTAQEEVLCFQRTFPSDRQQKQPEEVRQEPEEDRSNGDQVLMMP